MAIYQAIHPEIAIKTSDSDMVSLIWNKPRLVADFRIPGDQASVVRVECPRALIVRILDEMALSTETEVTEDEGLVPEHFAYKVRGAAFFFGQSEAFRFANPNLEHFRFITGWTCLDVMANEPPTVTIVARA